MVKLYSILILIVYRLGLRGFLLIWFSKTAIGQTWSIEINSSERWTSKLKITLKVKISKKFSWFSISLLWFSINIFCSSENYFFVKRTYYKSITCVLFLFNRPGISKQILKCLNVFVSYIGHPVRSDNPHQLPLYHFLFSSYSQFFI